MLNLIVLTYFFKIEEAGEILKKCLGLFILVALALKYLSNSKSYFVDGASLNIV
jgi:hypothetical protein